MIKHLSISNLAVIRELEVSFGPGLNIITGETGAGKSILIDAVGLLVGGRASADVIRTGAASAVVEGEFVNGGVSQLVRRVIRAGGASRTFVNDEPVKLDELSSLANSWVDLHGQHEHQSLLRVATHLDFLDAYAGLLPDREVLAHTYGYLVQVSRDLERLSDQVARAAEVQQLQLFQLKELDDADLSLEEEEALGREHRLLAQADELHRLLAAVENRLLKDETSLAGEAGALLKQLERYEQLSPELGQLHERLAALKVELEDLAYEAGRYGLTVTPDPQRLAQIEGRLGELETVKRKYGGSIPSAMKQRASLREALAAFDASDEQLVRLREERERLSSAYAAECQALSRQRLVARVQLAEAVMDTLTRLDMPGARMEVRLDNVADKKGLCVIDGQAYKSDASGFDHVEFYLSPNPGEDLRPLAKIASGGEVSRIMLGIKTVLAEYDQVGSLIFDEIDSGISGSTAELVGVALKELARARQVIVITHLPQIAARGDHHLTVSKSVIEGRTESAVRVVEGAARQREIARLLSGAEITGAGLDQAAELLAPSSRKASVNSHG